MDVHPTKNVSIGIDPYPKFKPGYPELRNSKNMAQKLETSKPLVIRSVNGSVCQYKFFD
jgi:hypothetical protein